MLLIKIEGETERPSLSLELLYINNSYKNSSTKFLRRSFQKSLFSVINHLEVVLQNAPIKNK